MTSQFDKKDRLVQALCKQQIIGNDSTTAEKIADVITRKIYKAGDVVIKQNDGTAELYFILTGKMAIKINDRTIAFRGKNQTVGEMALVDVGGKRSASVVAEEESELACIEEGQFTAIADKHPTLWRHIAQSLAIRLRERNGRERVKNSKPKIFIASSSESKDIVALIQDQLSGGSVELIPWTRGGLFAPTTHAIETLETCAREVDFAIIIVGHDDDLTSRGKEWNAPRDNVVFELGLFMGALIERKRIFIVESAEAPIKIPSDLIGLTTLRHKNSDELIELCKQIEKKISDLGPI